MMLRVCVVQVGGRLMQAVAARVGWRVIRFRTRGHARLAADADGRVVEKPDRCAGTGNLLGLAPRGSSLPIVTATAPVAPVLAIVVIRSRRVMATLFLFLAAAAASLSASVAIRCDSLDSRLFAAPEAL